MNGLIWFGTALFLIGMIIGSAEVAMIALGMTQDLPTNCRAGSDAKHKS